MKKNYSQFFGWLLCTSISCQKDADAPPGACSGTGKTVKTVTTALGTVFFTSALQQFVISIPEPGTIDVVDQGVVCGPLPSALRAAGTKVLVSGSLQEYGPQPAAPAGTT